MIKLDCTLSYTWKFQKNELILILELHPQKLTAGYRTILQMSNLFRPLMAWWMIPMTELHRLGARLISWRVKRWCEPGQVSFLWLILWSLGNYYELSIWLIQDWWPGRFLWFYTSLYLRSCNHGWSDVIHSTKKYLQIWMKLYQPWQVRWL